jgi:hypothetical protein
MNSRIIGLIVGSFLVMPLGGMRIEKKAQPSHNKGTKRKLPEVTPPLMPHQVSLVPFQLTLPIMPWNVHLPRRKNVLPRRKGVHNLKQLLKLVRTSRWD